MALRMSKMVGGGGGGGRAAGPRLACLPRARAAPAAGACPARLRAAPLYRLTHKQCHACLQEKYIRKHALEVRGVAARGGAAPSLLAAWLTGWQPHPLQVTFKDTLSRTERSEQVTTELEAKKLGFYLFHNLKADYDRHGVGWGGGGVGGGRHRGPGNAGQAWEGWELSPWHAPGRQRCPAGPAGEAHALLAARPLSPQGLHRAG